MPNLQWTCVRSSSMSDSIAPNDMAVLRATSTQLECPDPFCRYVPVHNYRRTPMSLRVSCANDMEERFQRFVCTREVRVRSLPRAGDALLERQGTYEGPEYAGSNHGIPVSTSSGTSDGGSHARRSSSEVPAPALSSRAVRAGGRSQRGRRIFSVEKSSRNRDALRLGSRRDCCSYTSVQNSLCPPSSVHAAFDSAGSPTPPSVPMSFSVAGALSAASCSPNSSPGFSA